MQLLRLHALDNIDLPAMAMTIGNFDGVHLGHQAMLAQLRRQAAEHGLKTMVMLFEPQPLELIKGYNAPPRLTNCQEKVRLLKQQRIDYVVIARFDSAFQNLSATQFADILHHKLNAKLLVLGDDFRFGHDRSGDSAFLSRYGFKVARLSSVTIQNQRISSTRIRSLIIDGRFEEAAQLLGRPYSITGRVTYGDQIGRTLDFPTANILLNRSRPCVHGVYGVQVTHLGRPPLTQIGEAGQSGVTGFAARSLFAAASVGTRPAIKNHGKDWRLEVYFPKFSANLYGLRLQVTFLKLLHGEKDYANLEALKTGIHRDVERLLDWRQSQVTHPFSGFDLSD